MRTGRFFSVRIIVGGWAHRLQPKVVDDEKRHAREGGEFSLVAADGARCIHALGKSCAGGEDDVHTLTHGTMSERLGEVRFACTAGPTMSTGAFSVR